MDTMETSRSFRRALSRVFVVVLVMVGLFLGHQVRQRRARAQGNGVPTGR